MPWETCLLLRPVLLHAGRSMGVVADLFYADVRSILMVFIGIPKGFTATVQNLIAAPGKDGVAVDFDLVDSGEIDAFMLAAVDGRVGILVAMLNACKEEGNAHQQTKQQVHRALTGAVIKSTAESVKVLLEHTSCTPHQSVLAIAIEANVPEIIQMIKDAVPKKCCAACKVRRRSTRAAPRRVAPLVTRSTKAAPCRGRGSFFFLLLTCVQY